MSGETAATTHYALLIGISCYRDQPLKGCVNDVREIEKRLVKSRKTIEIKTLAASPISPGSPQPTEDATLLPTYDNTLSSLSSIISQASPGDFVYIHYSGHGTTVKPESEPGGRSEPDSSTGDLALVLFDHGQLGIRYLHGRELGGLLKLAVEKGLKLTLVLDCCFSGSVVRKDDSVRYLPYNPNVDRTYPPLRVQDTVRSPNNRGASMRANWLVNPAGYAVFAACGPSELAGELSINATHHGAMSYFLLRAFDKLGRVGGRLHHIYAHLCARFREAISDQKPMLYGNKRLGFFEQASGEFYAAPIPIIRRGGALLLEAGEAHGVCVGDRFAWSSIDAGQRGSNGVPRGKEMFEAANVRSLLSDLKPLDQSGTSHQSGMTATACSHLSLQKYPIRLQLRLQRRHAWDSALQERPSLNIVSVNPAASTAYSFHVAVTSKDSYEIRDGSNKAIVGLPVPLVDLEEDPSFILDVVEHLTRFEMVKNLANRNPSQSFTESLHVELLDRESGRTFLPGCRQGVLFHPLCSHTSCSVEVKEGAELVLVVRNQGGPHQTLFLHVYNLGAFWEVENILKGDHDILPPAWTNMNREFRSGTDGVWRKKIKMMVPRELKDKGETQCEDIIKIFLTIQQTSFISLELPQIGDVCSQRKGSGSRGGAPRHESEDWVVLSFRIRTISK